MSATLISAQKLIVNLLRQIRYYCFSIKAGIQMENRFLENMKIVERTIRETRYVPYDQLYSYVRIGNSLYITCKNSARLIVMKMDPDMILRYLQLCKSGK